MFQVCPQVFADFMAILESWCLCYVVAYFLDVWHDIEGIVCSFVVVEGFPIELGLSGLLMSWGWNRGMLYQVLLVWRWPWEILRRRSTLGIFHGLSDYTDGSFGIVSYVGRFGDCVAGMFWVGGGLWGRRTFVDRPDNYRNIDWVNRNKYWKRIFWCWVYVICIVI